MLQDLEMSGTDQPAVPATDLRRWSVQWVLRLCAHPAFTAMALTLWLGAAGMAHGQVIPSGDAGRLVVSAGAAGSGYYLQYGARTMAGITGFVDIDSRSHFGVEAEGRWLEWNQTNSVHAETYSIGPRYHRNFGKLQPYAKGMVGLGDFTFAYNLANGRYLTVAAGGGVDYHLTDKIYIRAADFEYQFWPQFTFGNMTSLGVSSGIRVRVF
jgi:hypothetical protein